MSTENKSGYNCTHPCRLTVECMLLGTLVWVNDMHVLQGTGALSGCIPTSLLVTPWRAHPPFKGPNSKIVKATQLFQYSIWYPVSLIIAALPLQGICVRLGDRWSMSSLWEPPWRAIYRNFYRARVPGQGKNPQKSPEWGLKFTWQWFG